MTNKPASIVVPLRRQNDAWLRQCLESALAQTVPCEIVVVTASDTPESNRRVIDALRGNSRGHLQVIVRPPGTAYAAALNLGIRAATAERVGFLLTDDWLDERAVETCLAFSTHIVSTGLTIYAEDGVTIVGARRLGLAEFNALPSLEQKANYLKHFLLFCKEMLLAVGGVDESIGLTGPDDYDLVWTLLERGATVSVTDTPLYHYRDHFGERLSLRSREAQVRDLKKILKKHGLDGVEMQAAVERHAPWYGRPLHVYEAERRDN